MTLKWGNTSDAGLHGVKILVYGDSGSGKTTLLSTLARPVVASAESGLLSLRKMSIPYAEIRMLADLIEFYHWCNSKAAEGYDIGIDSVTEIAEVVLKNEKAMVKDPRMAYGELITKMQDLIKLFRDLRGKNVYMSAKMEYDKDEQGRMMFRPSMPGSKLGPALPYYFDEVFFMGIGEYQGNKYHFLQTHASPTHVAKDRSGSLAEMEEPHLGKVINKILGV